MNPIDKSISRRKNTCLISVWNREEKFRNADDGVENWRGSNSGRRFVPWMRYHLYRPGGHVANFICFFDCGTCHVSTYEENGVQEREREREWKKGSDSLQDLRRLGNESATVDKQWWGKRGERWKFEEFTGWIGDIALFSSDNPPLIFKTLLKIAHPRLACSR